MLLLFVILIVVMLLIVFFLLVFMVIIFLVVIILSWCGFDGFWWFVFVLYSCICIFLFFFDEFFFRVDDFVDVFVGLEIVF